MVRKIKYSVIIAYYKSCEEDEEKLLTLLNTLVYQEYEDFETLVVHDGIIDTPEWIKDYKDINIRFLCTDVRHNKYGHPSRNLGINESKGRFLLITNHDNLYYPDLFKNIDEVMVEEAIGYYIFRVRMVGMRYADGKIGYDEPRKTDVSIVIDGLPIEIGNIDIMQAVISKKQWDSFGGWGSIAIDSDGQILRKMSKNYKFKHHKHILGEHY